MSEAMQPSDVSFNPHVIAAAWEAFDDGMPAVAAAALVNELPNGVKVRANQGDEVDRDVHFPIENVMVEEKAMGVCPRDVAEEHAPAFVELDREDGYVLAINAGQVFEDYKIPA